MFRYNYNHPELLLIFATMKTFVCGITKFLLSCYYMEELNIQVQTAGINKVQNTVF